MRYQVFRDGVAWGLRGVMSVVMSRRTGNEVRQGERRVARRAMVAGLVSAGAVCRVG